MPFKIDQQTYLTRMILIELNCFQILIILINDINLFEHSYTGSSIPI